jgi:hypothetical protein
MARANKVTNTYLVNGWELVCTAGGKWYVFVVGSTYSGRPAFQCFALALAWAKAHNP